MFFTHAGGGVDAKNWSKDLARKVEILIPLVPIRGIHLQRCTVSGATELLAFSDDTILLIISRFIISESSPFFILVFLSSIVPRSPSLLLRWAVILCQLLTGRVNLRALACLATLFRLQGL